IDVEKAQAGWVDSEQFVVGDLGEPRVLHEPDCAPLSASKHRRRDGRDTLAIDCEKRLGNSLAYDDCAIAVARRLGEERSDRRVEKRMITATDEGELSARGCETVPNAADRALQGNLIRHDPDLVR